MTHPLRKRRAAFKAEPQHPVTPDGRYFVVRGKRRRMANPDLQPAKKAALVTELAKARSAVRSAKLAGNQIEEAAAHGAVDVIKGELDERGPVWWTDATPDLDRHPVKNTPTRNGIPA